MLRNFSIVLKEKSSKSLKSSQNKADKFVAFSRGPLCKSWETPHTVDTTFSYWAIPFYSSFLPSSTQTKTAFLKFSWASLILCLLKYWFLSHTGPPSSLLSGHWILMPTKHCLYTTYRCITNTSEKAMIVYTKSPTYEWVLFQVHVCKFNLFKSPTILA